MQAVRTFEFNSYDANGSNVLVKVDLDEIRVELLKSGKWPRHASFEDCLRRWVTENRAWEVK